MSSRNNPLVLVVCPETVLSDKQMRRLEVISTGVLTQGLIPVTPQLSSSFLKKSDTPSSKIPDLESMINSIGRSGAIQKVLFVIPEAFFGSTSFLGACKEAFQKDVSFREFLENLDGNQFKVYITVKDLMDDKNAVEILYWSEEFHSQVEKEKHESKLDQFLSSLSHLDRAQKTATLRRAVKEVNRRSRLR